MYFSKCVFVSVVADLQLGCPSTHSAAKRSSLLDVLGEAGGISLAHSQHPVGRLGHTTNVGDVNEDLKKSYKTKENEDAIFCGNRKCC